MRGLKNYLVPHYSYSINGPQNPILLDSERGNFKLLGLMYSLCIGKFELFGVRLLKKRVLLIKAPILWLNRLELISRANKSSFLSHCCKRSEWQQGSGFRV